MQVHPTDGLRVVAISGSPSAQSKTALLADAIVQRILGDATAQRIGEDGITVRHHRVASIPAEALLRGAADEPIFAAMAAEIAAAHGVIIATPVYKASFSGLLKCFLDVLPQFAFAGKAILPVGTGGSIAHVLALDYALRPVLQSMGARHIVQSHFMAEAGLRLQDGHLVLEEEAAAPLWEAVRHFTGALTSDPASGRLGHPRPVTA